MTIFGPFKTLRDAERANYFAKSIKSRDDAAELEYLPRHCHQGIETYDSLKLNTVVEGHALLGYKAVKTRPADCLKVHESWRKLPVKHRDFLFHKDSSVKLTKGRP